MTDTAPAYAQALDQLRAERDAAVARADAAERQWAAIAQTPDGGWHFAHERAAAQLAEVTAERDELRANLTAAEDTNTTALAFIGTLGGIVGIARADCASLSEWVNRIGTALAPITAERDHMRSVIPELEAQLDHWKAKHVTPRTPTDLEERTGPVAFERNQLRDENVRLREEVATLAAELDGTRARLTMTTRDLDAAERAVVALKAVAHAIVNAVAKGAP